MKIQINFYSEINALMIKKRKPQSFLALNKKEIIIPETELKLVFSGRHKQKNMDLKFFCDQNGDFFVEYGKKIEEIEKNDFFNHQIGIHRSIFEEEIFDEEKCKIVLSDNTEQVLQKIKKSFFEELGIHFFNGNLYRKVTEPIFLLDVSSPQSMKIIIPNTFDILTYFDLDYYMGTLNDEVISEKHFNFPGLENVFIDRNAFSNFSYYSELKKYLESIKLPYLQGLKKYNIMDKQKFMVEILKQNSELNTEETVKL